MYLAIDVETSYADKDIALPWKEEAYLSTVAIVTSEGEEKYWVFRHDSNDGSTSDRDKAADIQRHVSEAKTVCGHNLPFDLHWLQSLGVDFDGVKLYDTSIAEYLLSGQTVMWSKLDDLAEQRLHKKKHDVVKLEYWDQGINTAQIPIDVLSEYNVQDCRLTLGIVKQQAGEIVEANIQQLVRLKMEEIRCVVDIEGHGLGVDDERRLAIQSMYQGKLDACKQALWDAVGKEYNLSSPQQVSVMLYGGTLKEDGREYYQRTLKSGRIKECSRKCKVPTYYEGLGLRPLPNSKLDYKDYEYFSSDKSIVGQLYARASVEQRKVLDLLLEYSELDQILTTYVNALDGKLYDGVVHGNLNQTATVTGRFSASNPNMQNIPRDSTAPVKQYFVPQLDEFVEGDASQLEWRVAAFLSQCPVMMDEIENGVDQHGEVRREMFDNKVERVIAKIFNFRMIYGGSPFSFYADHKMPAFSKKKWEAIVAAFYEKYHGLATWHDKLVRDVTRNGGVMYNPTGRKFVFKKYKGRYGSDYKRPQILNYPVQSLATADMIPLAMNEMRKRLTHLRMDGTITMCLQVHDSIMFDIRREVRDEVAHTMMDVFRELPQLVYDTFGFEYNVPSDGEIKYGNRWSEMEVWTG